MQGMSEDEGGEEDVPEIKFDEEKAAQARKARAERDAELKRMMEESGEFLKAQVRVAILT
jgi:DNA polymerase delta subunit 3